MILLVKFPSVKTNILYGRAFLGEKRTLRHFRICQFLFSLTNQRTIPFLELVGVSPSVHLDHSAQTGGADFNNMPTSIDQKGRKEGCRIVWCLGVIIKWGEMTEGWVQQNNVRWDQNASKPKCEWTNILHLYWNFVNQEPLSTFSLQKAKQHIFFTEGKQTAHHHFIHLACCASLGSIWWLFQTKSPKRSCMNNKKPSWLWHERKVRDKAPILVSSLSMWRDNWGLLEGIMKSSEIKIFFEKTCRDDLGMHTTSNPFCPSKEDLK